MVFDFAVYRLKLAQVGQCFVWGGCTASAGFAPAPLDSVEHAGAQSEVGIAVGCDGASEVGIGELECVGECVAGVGHLGEFGEVWEFVPEGVA